MSNIHGFGDPNAENNGNNENQGQQGFFNQQQGLANDNPMMALMGGRGDKNPRDETFWDMITYTFCPTFAFRSLTWIISCVNAAIFLLTLFTDGIQMEGSLLQVQTGFFIRSFSCVPSKVKTEFQIWRLITPVFFHHDLSHIVMNTFSLLIWGSLIETLLGTIITVKIYFISAVGGCLMSVLCHKIDIRSIGASGAIFGITGAAIGILILNWKALGESQYAQMRSMIVCMVVMVVIFNGMMLVTTSNTTGGSKVDNYAHLGGFLTGTVVSMIIGKCMRDDTDYEKKVRKFASFGLLGLTAVLLILLIVNR